MADKKKREALTRADQVALLDFLGENIVYAVYQPMIGFALSTALRVGELTGVCWRDIDSEMNVIHIHRQLVNINSGEGNKFRLAQLKTAAGRRDIPITPEIRGYLEKQWQYSRVLKQNAADRNMAGGESDFIFVNAHEEPFMGTEIRHLLENIVDAYNEREIIESNRVGREAKLLPHISAHLLRHTAYIRYVEAGLSLKELQYIMGHAEIKPQ